MLDLHHLPGSDLQETKVQYYRRHPITLFPVFFITILVFVLPPASYFLLNFLFAGIFATQTNLALFLLAASAFFLSGWLFIFQMFIEYWLDVFIVTDKRILDIDQKGLFDRTVSELRLYRTQDATAQIKGILHTLLDYGDIFVETAGEQERFHFEDIPHPNQIAKAILEMSEVDRKEHLDEAVEDFGMPDKGANGAAVAVAKKTEP
ncbi:MAG: PH domain-containing protein [Patescibacteria group bacterium]